MFGGHLYYANHDGVQLQIWILEDYDERKWALKHKTKIDCLVEKHPQAICSSALYKGFCDLYEIREGGHLLFWLHMKYLSVLADDGINAESGAASQHSYHRGFSVLAFHPDLEVVFLGMGDTVLSYNLNSMKLEEEWVSKPQYNGLHSGNVYPFSPTKRSRNSPLLLYTYTYRPLISGLCLTGRVSEAKEFIDDLHRENCRLNEICFSTLMHGYCKEGRLNEVYNVCKEMVEREVEMDLIFYSILIYGVLKHHDKIKLLCILKEMLNRGLRPDNVIYTTVIDRYCKQGNLTEAFGFWNKMITEGCIPNVVTYIVLINGLCEARFVDKAELLCKEMLVKSFLPNEMTCGCFLDWLTKEGNMDKAVELHKPMVGGLLANSVTYNMLINGFCKSGRIQDATALLGEMINDGRSPDCISYSILIYGRGDLHAALKLWNEMLNMGLKPDMLVTK
ncbi:putative pentatricopeptide repeat-containing protein At5g59900 [Magnolia sinica]|uniref:putative pentatricopeptide repeat-containing protein At5g59900 n=1 Tax=Magnolia sinica TaxID=86752 RepID=UPI002658F429|nr:putative pentatricopeptide repeat-containing protein At5g59900 [Magnolia sinica]